MCIKFPITIETLPLKTLLPFSLDRADALNLQDQLRREIVSLIVSGTWPAGSRVPSSRHVAETLKISRNTAILAYQKLTADGYLVSRPKKGLFVANDAEQPWATGMVAGITSTRIASPDEAQRYIPFPFVDGIFDQDLFPADGWREATELASKRKQIESWSVIAGDDPALIEKIRTRVLPRRGIFVSSEEILLTLGAQHARALCLELVCAPNMKVGVEEPGQPLVRSLVETNGAEVVPQLLDTEGIMLDGLDRCGAVFVTPSHQLPTGLTMSEARRKALIDLAAKHDLTLIEDDFESETNYLDEALPALWSMQKGGRFMYVASLAKVLDPSLCLGFVVADRETVAELRILRQRGAQQPPLNTQRTAAHFLALGHYDRMMRRLCGEFRKRIIALRDALNHYLPRSVEVQPFRGGTTLWVRAKDGINVGELAALAARRGVMIETVEPYFAKPSGDKLFRLGITGVPLDRIRFGVATLSDAVRELSGVRETGVALLSNDALQSRMAGATLSCRTVYGEPCIIKLHADGSMSGHAGEAWEDTDQGVWRVENCLWFRRWQNWAYGEEVGFAVAIDDNVIRWLNRDGYVVDWAYIS